MVQCFTLTFVITTPCQQELLNVCAGLSRAIIDSACYFDPDSHSIYGRLCALQAVASAAVEAPAAVTEADVVIIGSGIAGLCCGSLLAKYGYKVHVCESHYHAGGAAHAFEVKVNALY
jgi:NADPH-dependent 2,4-dienoyl-CoA reductase/sulfur reductase-like enzyme